MAPIAKNVGTKIVTSSESFLKQKKVLVRHSLISYYLLQNYLSLTVAEIAYDVTFKGDGWLEIDRSVMMHKEEREVLGLEISTNKTNGLILWHGQTPNYLNPDDYIALAVVDG